MYVVFVPLRKKSGLVQRNIFLTCQKKRSDIMGSAHSSNVSQQSMVSNTTISTTVQQQQKSNSIGANAITQICGDITGQGTVACGMKNITQGVTTKTTQKAVQDAMLKTISQTDLNQALKQMSKATVSNFNLFNFSDAVNQNIQNMSMMTDISNEVVQKCLSEGSATNSILQKCGKVSEGAKGCQMDNVAQSINTDIKSDCTQKAIVNSEVMHKAVQRAEQTAVAKTIGLDLVSGLIAAAIIFLTVTVGGGVALGKGVVHAMPLISAGVLTAGIAVWVYAALQKDPNNPQYNMGYVGTGGKYHQQPLASVFPSKTYFPDVDYSNFRNYQADHPNTTLDDFCGSFTDKDACNANQGLCASETSGGKTTCVSAYTGFGYPVSAIDNTADGIKEICRQRRANNQACAGWLWTTSKPTVTTTAPSCSNPTYANCARYLNENGEANIDCKTCCPKKGEFANATGDDTIMCNECVQEAPNGTGIIFAPRKGTSTVTVPDGKGGGGIHESSKMTKDAAVGQEKLTCEHGTKELGVIYVDGPFNLRVFIAIILIVAGTVMGIVSLFMSLSDSGSETAADTTVEVVQRLLRG